MTDVFSQIREKYKDRRICVAYPSNDYISTAFSVSLFELVTQTAPVGIPLGLANAVGSRITKNRCNVVENARQFQATDILWIDADSIFPINSLIRLLVHDKDIVCATTCRRKGSDRSPVAIPFDINSIQPYQKLVAMKQVGMPFMLTSMKVFDKLDAHFGAKAKPYFAEPPRWMMKDFCPKALEGDDLVGEDEYFCELVLEAGMEIWCDMELSMEIGHLGVAINYIEQPKGPAAPAHVDINLEDETPKVVSAQELLDLAE